MIVAFLRGPCHCRDETAHPRWVPTQDASSAIFCASASFWVKSFFLADLLDDQVAPGEVFFEAARDRRTMIVACRHFSPMARYVPKIEEHGDAFP